MRAEHGYLKRHAIWSGYAGALLFGVGSGIWGLEMPEDGAPISRVVDFYEETADRIVIGGSMSLIAVGVLILFAAAVRQVLIEAGSEEFLATTAFGGALVCLVAGMGAESVNLSAALRARDGELSDALAQSLFEISQILGSAATGVGLGVFAISVGVAALRTRRILPVPVAIGLLSLGVVLLTPLAHLNWLPGVALVLVASTIPFWLMLGYGERSATESGAG